MSPKIRRRGEGGEGRKGKGERGEGERRGGVPIRFEAAWHGFELLQAPRGCISTNGARFLRHGQPPAPPAPSQGHRRGARGARRAAAGAESCQDHGRRTHAHRSRPEAAALVCDARPRSRAGAIPPGRSRAPGPRARPPRVRSYRRVLWPQSRCACPLRTMLYT